MSMPTAPGTANPMPVLSRLLLPRRKADGVQEQIANISREKFDEVVNLAQLNHVIIRALTIVHSHMRDVGDDMRAEGLLPHSQRNRNESKMRFWCSTRFAKRSKHPAPRLR